jgi:hypothetical protein
MMFGNNIESSSVLKRIPINTVGVELGVWKGDSSERFLSKAKHLHLVDAWAPESYQESKEHGTYEDFLERYSVLVGSKDPQDFVRYYNKVYEAVKDRFILRPVTIHRMSTREFFDKFKEKVDWVYVDAAHDHDGCYFDLMSSLKIVKPGGSIFGDDYHNKPGVKSAVDQFIADHDLVLNNFYKSQFEIKL